LANAQEDGIKYVTDRVDLQLIWDLSALMETLHRMLCNFTLTDADSTLNALKKGDEQLKTKFKQTSNPI